MLNKKALAASVSAPPAIFSEDVFSTFLYTGNGSTQTITNGIDLAGEGGMVWLKDRSGASINQHTWVDTNRGVSNWINSASTFEQSPSNILSSYNADGFTLSDSVRSNQSGASYCSWTFRKAPKFFDVVTYTGTGSARTIAHNLGSVPGMIIVKRTDTTGAWQVYHRANTANPETDYLVLNTTAVTADNINRWNDTLPTSSVFSLGTDATVNASGGTYVAYIYAHDAGGFGTAGTDNVISCGSFDTDGSSNMTAPVNLGYEPQLILYKCTGTAENWFMVDIMRGASVTSTNLLYPNLSDIEDSNSPIFPTATGFNARGSILVPSKTYIYMAIRRPMKVPTTGTEVFSPVARTGTGANATVSSGFVTDAVLIKNRGSVQSNLFSSRLINTKYLTTSSTAAEVTAGTTVLQANPWDVMDGVKVGTTSTITNASSTAFINYLFRRAPNFFDVVCYTGTGSARTVAHNLGVVPDLIILKNRDAPSIGEWAVNVKSINENNWVLNLHTTEARFNNALFSSAPTASSMTFSGGQINESGSNYIVYLFATLDGISKVGSYTGNGSSQTINCGFTGGARFVMVKATSTTGNWVILDTARGIVTGVDDPFLRLNVSTADVTNQDIVDPNTSGFIVKESTEAINSSGITYIYLAIA
jgi:hypothetical protein